MNKDLQTALQALSNEKVKYAVIRSLPWAPLLPSKDVDLLVHKDDLGNTKSVLRGLGFHYARTTHPKMGFYFKKILSKGLLTLHIQTEVFFLKEKSRIVLSLSDLVINSSVSVQGCRFASDQMNSFLIAGKLKYEGKELTEKYMKILERCPLGSTREGVIDSFDDFLHSRSIDVVKCRVKNNVIKRGIRTMYRVFSNIRGSHNISIHGIDGTGKTSTAANLRDRLGNRLHVHYLGRKEWKLPIARTVFTNRGNGWDMVKSPLRPMILYIEMVFRILRRARFKGVHLYDRHPSEFFLGMNGMRRFVYWMMFYIMFVRPRYCIYLTCSKETSILRKSDLDGEEVAKILSKRKEAYDAHFLKRKNIIVVDTDVLDQNGVIEYILGRLPKNLAKFL